MSNYDRATVIQGTSLLIASLPVLYLLLPTAVRKWLTIWPVTRKRPSNYQGLDSSEESSREIERTGNILRDNTLQETRHAPKIANPGPVSPPTICTSSMTDSPSSPSTLEANQKNGSMRFNASLTPNSAFQRPSASTLMPPPPLPPQISKQPAVHSLPTLPSGSSRTSSLAQKTSLQARRRPATLSPAAANGSLKPMSPPTTSTLPTPSRPRQKVILKPGHSPLDWAHLTSSTPAQQLAGVARLLRVTPSMLKEHDGRKGRPAWSAFKGRVYNIGPYTDFHPGGVGELRRGAGKAGDKLFDEIHPWVNVDGMLSSCLVGLLVSEHEDSRIGDSQNLDSLD